jgi:hypothetical protein
MRPIVEGASLEFGEAFLRRFEEMEPADLLALGRAAQDRAVVSSPSFAAPLKNSTFVIEPSASDAIAARFTVACAAGLGDGRTAPVGPTPRIGLGKPRHEPAIQPWNAGRRGQGTAASSMIESQYGFGLESVE